MKNSLFKRAVAAAAAVPLALTQCLTYSSFAVSTDAVKVAEDAIKADASADTSITLEKLCYIAPDDADQISDWNILAASALSNVVATGNATGTLDTAKLVEIATSYAGSYSDIVAAMASQVKDVTYEISDANDITITAKVDNVTEALQSDVNRSLGNNAKELAEKYNAPELADIDYTKVDISGEIKVTIKGSELDLGTEVTVDAEFTSAEGDTYTAYDAIKTYALGKLEELRQVAYDAIDSVDGIDNAAAKADVDEAIDSYVKLFNRAANGIDKALGLEKSKTGTDVPTLIQAASALIQKKFNKTINGSTATEVLTSDKAGDAYTEALAQLNAVASPYTVDIDAASLGAFLDSLENVDFTLTGGVATLTGEFDDAEQEDVKAYVEEQGNIFVDSYKVLTGIVDFNGAKTADASSVSVEIKRILVTDTTDTTTTTTSDTTTTTTSDTTTTTTSDTTTTTTSDTTTTTTSTTSYELETVIDTYYVTANTNYAFYLSLEEEFDTAQVSNPVLHIVYAQGYTNEDGEFVTVSMLPEETVDLSASISFGDKTPANTYDEGRDDGFDYDVPVVYTGETITASTGEVILSAGDTLKDESGNDLTVEVYIGLKGDTDLNNVVDGRDASATLTYYAKQSTGGTPDTTILSYNELGNVGPATIYEQFSAFLSDVSKSELEAGVTRSSSKAERTIDGRDASAILTYYAKQSVDTYRDYTESQLWDLVLGSNS